MQAAHLSVFSAATLLDYHASDGDGVLDASDGDGVPRPGAMYATERKHLLPSCLNRA